MSYLEIIKVISDITDGNFIFILQIFFNRFLILLKKKLYKKINLQKHIHISNFRNSKTNDNIILDTPAYTVVKKASLVFREAV